MRFYRLGHIDNQQGLWYDRNGSFAGRIHNDYSDFKNSEMPMNFDPEIIGYLSVTKSLRLQRLCWLYIRAYIDGV
jgi:hypothetical protein